MFNFCNKKPIDQKEWDFSIKDQGGRKSKIAFSNFDLDDKGNIEGTGLEKSFLTKDTKVKIKGKIKPDGEVEIKKQPEKSQYSFKNGRMMIDTDPRSRAYDNTYCSIPEKHVIRRVTYHTKFYENGLHIGSYQMYFKGPVWELKRTPLGQPEYTEKIILSIRDGKVLGFSRLTYDEIAKFEGRYCKDTSKIEFNEVLLNKSPSNPYDFVGYRRKTGFFDSNKHVIEGYFGKHGEGNTNAGTFVLTYLETYK